MLMLHFKTTYNCRVAAAFVDYVLTHLFIFSKVNFYRIMNDFFSILGKMVHIHESTNDCAHCIFLVLRHTFLVLSSLESKCTITLSDSSQL